MNTQFGLGHPNNTNNILLPKETPFDFDHTFNVLFGRTVEDVERNIQKNSCCLGLVYKNELGEDYGRVKRALLENEIFTRESLARECENLQGTTEEKQRHIQSILAGLPNTYLESIRNKKKQEKVQKLILNIMLCFGCTLLAFSIIGFLYRRLANQY